MNVHIFTTKDCTHTDSTHCNTLQHTVTHCDTLRHTATHCTHWMAKKPNLHSQTTQSQGEIDHGRDARDLLYARSTRCFPYLVPRVLCQGVLRVCCKVLRYARPTRCFPHLSPYILCQCVLQCVAVCCGVLRCVAVRAFKNIVVRIWFCTYCVNVLCVLQINAVCASYTLFSVSDSVHVVLQCVAVCCSVLQCVEVCCRMSVHHVVFHMWIQYQIPCMLCCNVLQCVVGWCSVLRCVAMCCSVSVHHVDFRIWFRACCVTVRNSVLQCVAECGSML